MFTFQEVLSLIRVDAYRLWRGWQVKGDAVKRVKSLVGKLVEPLVTNNANCGGEVWRAGWEVLRSARLLGEVCPRVLLLLLGGVVSWLQEVTVPPSCFSQGRGVGGEVGGEVRRS